MTDPAEILRDACAAGGVDPEGIDDALRELQRVEAERPGTVASAVPIAADLARAGVDPRYLLARAAPPMAAHAARHGQPLTEWLAPCATHARTLQAAGIDHWSSFSFGLEALAKTCGPDAGTFAAILHDYAELLKREEAHGVQRTRTHQYGFGVWCEVVGPRPWAVQAFLDWAGPLVDVEGDVGWLLQVALSQWFEHWLGVRDGTEAYVAEPPMPPPDGDLRAWLDAALGALRPFCLAVAKAGMHVGMPLATGLAALGRYGPAMVPHLPGWLDRLLAVIRAVFQHEGTPYGPLRYGLPEVCRPSLLTPEQFTLALDLGVTLADRGLDPGTVWHDALLAPVSDAIPFEACVDIAQRCAAAGADPRFLLRDTLPAVVQAGIGADVADDLVSLAGTLAAAGLRSQKTFEDGLPFVARYTAERPGAFRQALAAARGLADHGVAPGMFLAHGLSMALVGDDVPAWLLNECCALAADLGPAGIDPETTCSNAFVVARDVTGDDRAAFARLRHLVTELVLALERRGIPSRDVLYRDIPAIAQVPGVARSGAFERLLRRLREVLSALHTGGVDPGPFCAEGLPALAGAARTHAWMLDAGLDLAQRLGAAGVDPGPVLQHGVPAVAAGAPADAGAFSALLDAVESAARALTAAQVATLLPKAATGAAALVGADPGGFGAALHAALDRLLAADLPDDRRADAADSLSLCAEIAHGDLAAYGRLVDGALTIATDFARANRNAGAVLWYGLRAIARVADGHADVAARLLASMAERLLVRAPSPALYGCTERAPGLVAGLAGTDPTAFLAGYQAVLRCVDAFAAGDDAGAAVVRDCVAAAEAASRDVARFVAVLDALSAMLAEPAMLPAASRIANELARARGLLRAAPDAWERVVRPALAAHGPRAAAVLEPLRWIGEGHLRAPSDCDVLASIVTQTGVRAVEWLTGLVVAGLHARVITDLTAERPVIERFIAEVGFADPRIYASFREIQADAGLTTAERRARTEGLRVELGTLAAAIRSGDVTPEHERHPLFPLMLYYVFPPACSAPHDHYAQLFRQMQDRPGDLVRRDPGSARRHAYRLAQGAWELRPGAELDRTPFLWLVALARAVPSDLPPGDDAALGWDLLGRWAEGRVGRDPARGELLARLLTRARAGGVDVPTEATTPAQLLACKEFLGDHVRDAVEAALVAARAPDAARYDRLVRDKLAPPSTVGPGLVKSCWQLHEQMAAGRVDADAAARRLSGQLRGFRVDAPALARALAAARDPADVERLLRALPPEEVVIQHGKEQQRLLADLCGGELAAMNRELFGAPGHAAKLRYRVSADAPAYVLTCEVTKRQAHAVVGLAQGVCVAGDTQLWANPDFFQVVFWGPDGVCAGGMHVLVVHDRDADYVTLPGINPSMRLLSQVEPAAALDLAVDYAWRLARAWGCAGVWVPAAPVIHSNRRAIHLEIERRAWPLRETARHQFSYSPYNYQFAEVLVVPEAYVPETP